MRRLVGARGPGRRAAGGSVARGGGGSLPPTARLAAHDRPRPPLSASAAEVRQCLALPFVVGGASTRAPQRRGDGGDGDDNGGGGCGGGVGARRRCGGGGGGGGAGEEARAAWMPARRRQCTAPADAPVPVPMPSLPPTSTSAPTCARQAGACGRRHCAATHNRRRLAHSTPMTPTGPQRRRHGTADLRLQPDTTWSHRRANPSEARSTRAATLAPSASPLPSSVTETTPREAEMAARARLN